MLLVGGPKEVIAPLHHTAGPLIVDDLAQMQAMLAQTGALITHPLTRTPNGAMLYARHLDGNMVDYVQWRPEPVKHSIR